VALLQKQTGNLMYPIHHLHPVLVYAHVPTERESEKERKREEKGEFLVKGPCRCPQKSCQYCSPTSLYIVSIPNIALPIAAKKPRQ